MVSTCRIIYFLVLQLNKNKTSRNFFLNHNFEFYTVGRSRVIFPPPVNSEVGPKSLQRPVRARVRIIMEFAVCLCCLEFATFENSVESIALHETIR